MKAECRRLAHRTPAAACVSLLVAVPATRNRTLVGGGAYFLALVFLGAAFLVLGLAPLFFVGAFFGCV